MNHRVITIDVDAVWAVSRLACHLIAFNIIVEELCTGNDIEFLST